MITWVAIGSEILSGRTVDQNLKQLALALGLPVSRGFIVSDNYDEIARTFSCVAGDPVVICSGGLGPTSDDITISAFSKWSCLGLEFKEELYARFNSLDENLSSLEGCKKQCYIPKGFNFIVNAKGTAPLIWGDFKLTRWFFLPGVPHEFRSFVESSEFLNLVVEKTSRKRVYQRDISVYFMKEAEVYDVVKDITQHFSDEVGFYPEKGYVDIVLRSEDEALIDNRARILADRLTSEGIRFHIKEIPLELEVHNEIKRSGLTVSTVESFTGGALAQALMAYPGSSKYFKGGLVVYSVDAKKNLLGGKSVVNPVSEEVCEALAKQGRLFFKSDICVSTTGVAGPGKDEWENEEGLFFIAVAFNNDVRVWKRVIKTSRDLLIRQGVFAGLFGVLDCLKG
ncbi:MAG: nicotinamide-nucleotide amidohydrolase family protein [Deltaproteobacteria bacterium]|nr:nicotinamide-nucleotide amidohydrolase family protein [Deltaproteobacteria bacterium]